eukprot:scaffold120341_cov57-Phaeocystis_antarctica.AAC.1
MLTEERLCKRHPGAAPRCSSTRHCAPLPAALARESLRAVNRCQILRVPQRSHEPAAQSPDDARTYVSCVSSYGKSSGHVR